LIQEPTATFNVLWHGRVAMKELS